MRKLPLLAVLLFLSLVTHSQSTLIDSLHNVYLTAPVEKKYKALYRYCFYLTSHDSEKVIELLEEASNEIYKSGLSKSECAYHMGLFSEVKAIIARNKGDHEESLTHYQDCFEFSKNVEGENKHSLQGLAHSGSGFYYGQAGIFRKSTAEFLKASDAYTAANDPGKVADCYAMLAQNYQQLEQYDSTLLFCNKALSLKKSETIDKKYYYIFFKANAFNRSGMEDSTIVLLNEDLLNGAKKIRPDLYGHFSLALADAYTEKKRIPEAKKYLNIGKKVADNSEDNQLYINYLDAHHKFLRASNDITAYDAFKVFAENQDSIQKALTNAKFTKLQAEYDAHKKEYEITTLKSENRYQSNMMKMGGLFFAITIGGLLLWFKNREEKIKAIQAKNNQQIKVAFKYDDVENEIEDDFLKNVTGFIQENLQNEDFSVEDLVQKCGRSRKAMNKKLKSLTNKTAVGLIRDVRLDKAYTILSKNNANVSQTAFEVGFKDPNYFSSCFSDKFGFPPSEILKKSASSSN